MPAFSTSSSSHFQALCFQDELPSFHEYFHVTRLFHLAAFINLDAMDIYGGLFLAIF